MSQRPDSEKAWLLGLGLDNTDGHTRITRSDDTVLLGGSEETHERMQEHAIRIGEELERRGKALEECSMDEVSDIVREAAEEC